MRRMRQLRPIVVAVLAVAFVLMVLPGLTTAHTPNVVDRRVGLRLGGHLKATGHVYAEHGGPKCTADVLVRLERFFKSTDSWEKVGETHTNQNGRFEIQIPDQRGHFRAVAVAFDERGPLCRRDLSAVKFHRH